MLKNNNFLIGYTNANRNINTDNEIETNITFDTNTKTETK